MSRGHASRLGCSLCGYAAHDPPHPNAETGNGGRPADEAQRSDSVCSSQRYRRQPRVRHHGEHGTNPEHRQVSYGGPDIVNQGYGDQYDDRRGTGQSMNCTNQRGQMPVPAARLGV